MSKKGVNFTIQTSWIIKPAKIRVSVYDTISQMQDSTGNPSIGGLCERWHIDNKPLDGQVVAHIHLHRKGLGGGVVSHEATHAAIHIYGISKKYADLEDDDELLCYTVGDIVSKIYKQLYKRGIL